MAPASLYREPMFLVWHCGHLVCSSEDSARKVARFAIEGTQANEGAEPALQRHSVWQNAAGTDTGVKPEVLGVAPKDSRLSGSESRAGPCMEASEDSLAPSTNQAMVSGGKSIKGSSQFKSAGKRKCRSEDDQRQQGQLHEFGLQRPLLIGPFRGFEDRLVGDIVARFCGSVQRAQVMKGERSQSERCSLMLWLSDRVGVTLGIDRGWPVTISDSMGGCTVVQGLKGIFPTGLEHVGVQQAKKHFAPGNDAVTLSVDRRGISTAISVCPRPTAPSDVALLQANGAHHRRSDRHAQLRASSVHAQGTDGFSESASSERMG